MRHGPGHPWCSDVDPGAPAGAGGRVLAPRISSHPRRSEEAGSASGLVGHDEQVVPAVLAIRGGRAHGRVRGARSARRVDCQVDQLGVRLLPPTHDRLRVSSRPSQGARDHVDGDGDHAGCRVCRRRHHGNRLSTSVRAVALDDHDSRRDLAKYAAPGPVVLGALRAASGDRRADEPARERDTRNDPAGERVSYRDRPRRHRRGREGSVGGGLRARPSGSHSLVFDHPAAGHEDHDSAAREHRDQLPSGRARYFRCSSWASC